MKIGVWFHISDCGDGSASITPYATEAEADAAAEEEMEEYGQSLNDNVVYEVLDISKFEVVEP